MAQPMPVSFENICTAFDFASAGGFHEHRAFLCRRTGKIYYHSDFSDLNDDLPEDIEDEEKYIALPDKREIGLGKPLALNFARECLPDDFDEIRYIFSRRGGYKKFRVLLGKRNALDRWYEFEKEATDQTLRDWCRLNSINLVD